MVVNDLILNGCVKTTEIFICEKIFVIGIKIMRKKLYCSFFNCEKKTRLNICKT